MLQLFQARGKGIGVLKTAGWLLGACVLALLTTREIRADSDADVRRVESASAEIDDQLVTARIERISLDMNTENARRRLLSRAQGVSTGDLKVVTFNFGLLDRFAGYLSVPEYERRSSELGRVLRDFLRREQPDVCLFQELWHQPDFDTVVGVAHDLGFLPMLDEFPGWVNSPHGLQVLVSLHALRPHTGYEQVEYTETFPSTLEQLVGTTKGFLSAVVTLSGGHRLLVVDVHLSYDPEGAESRAAQIEAITQALRHKAERADYLVVGGDFNSSDVYPSAVQTRREILDDGWYRDKHVYEQFFKTTRFASLIDTYRCVNPHVPGFTQDRTRNQIAYYGLSTSEEPEQRLDYIWFGSMRKDLSFAVMSSKLVFTDPLVDNEGQLMRADEYDRPGQDAYGANLVDVDRRGYEAGEIYLSDHFGVLSRIRLGR